MKKVFYLLFVLLLCSGIAALLLYNFGSVKVTLEVVDGKDVYQFGDTVNFKVNVRNYSLKPYDSNNFTRMIFLKDEVDSDKLSARPLLLAALIPPNSLDLLGGPGPKTQLLPAFGSVEYDASFKLVSDGVFNLDELYTSVGDNLVIAKWSDFYSDPVVVRVADENWKSDDELARTFLVYDYTINDKDLVDLIESLGGIAETKVNGVFTVGYFPDVPDDQLAELRLELKKNVTARSVGNLVRGINIFGEDYDNFGP